MKDDPHMRSNLPDAGKQEWLAGLQSIGDEPGFFERIGNRHYALLTEASPTLLVTFENIDEIRRDSIKGLPLGFDLIKDNGWSHLGLLSDGNTWFRDQAIYDYFDQLVDEGFFEDFDRVIFLGASACGYAAAAYSVVAPGSTVIAISPQATMDPRVTEWDHRFKSCRRTSFTDRYGYAPDMIDGADAMFLLYDPEDEMDAMHAALFTRPHVTKLRCRYFGRHILQDLIQMDILQPLIDTAGTGENVANQFFGLFRARHDYPPYLQRLLRHLDDDDRCFLSGLLCRHANSRTGMPEFQQRLTNIEIRLRGAGVELPRRRVRRKPVTFQPLT